MLQHRTAMEGLTGDGVDDRPGASAAGLPGHRPGAAGAGPTTHKIERAEQDLLRPWRALVHPAVLRQPARVLCDPRPLQRAAHRGPAGAAHRIPHPLHGGNDLPRDDARRAHAARTAAGVAQILKVRLIHATIRNLILRGNAAGRPPSHDLQAQGNIAGRAANWASSRACLAGRPCTRCCSPVAGTC